MDIILFSKEDCQFCEIAEGNLKRKKLNYTKKILNENYNIEEVENITGDSKENITFPVCVVDGNYVGNAKDLHGYIRQALKAVR